MFWTFPAGEQRSASVPGLHHRGVQDNSHGPLLRDRERAGEAVNFNSALRHLNNMPSFQRT